MVPVKNCARAMACHLHGDALRDATVDHVTHCGSPKVVREHPGAAGALARRRPRAPDVPPWPSDLIAVERGEERWNDTAETALERPHALDLRAQQRLELRGQIDNAAFVVLRGAGVQPERTGLEVELSALEGKDRARRPPSEGVGERDRRLEVLQELTANGKKLLTLEEALPAASPPSDGRSQAAAAPFHWRSRVGASD